MNAPSSTITMAHGNGGSQTHRLIRSLFLNYFGSSDSGDSGSDGARIETGSISVFSTDSHVVRPLFFPGGDIGKLAVNGTVNDLAVSGADPLYLSAGFIIEEGFSYNDLERVVASMAEAAKQAGVRIVTGDTKVVEKGAADGLYINTAGVGRLRDDAPEGIKTIQKGDRVIVSGSVGDHGMALFAAREGMDFKSDLQSDCAPVVEGVRKVLETGAGVRVMRDPTRGGLATTLNEFVESLPLGIELDETAIPIKDQVKGIAALTGFDPLQTACEGRFVLVVAESAGERVLSALRGVPGCEGAALIGNLTDRYPGQVIGKTEFGGERIIDMLTGEMLPRIC